ncbi:MFS transporter [Virgisporangium ochraceum]|uniref:MFS transporter n=1 Tax=Virgisporangium ochraceum TaxID=65505 RepID=A0A8J3ZVI2_9ACTN|nr:MFS transporter [Virgisporangium ochraceum]GIJ68196.1 MFS transporter [Virgisporangium ochraceum]
MASYRWLVLGAGTAAQAAAAAYLVGLAAIAPALRAEYDLGLTGLGLFLGAPTLGMVASLMAWGWASDRYGERVVMTVGLGTTGVLLLLVPLLPGALVLLFLAGAAASGVNAASGRAVMAWFPARGRGFAMAVRQCGLPFGAALAAAVLPVLADRGGTTLAFRGLAVFALAGAVAVFVVVRSSGTGRGGLFRDVLRHGPLLRLCAVAVLLMLPQVAITAFGVELLLATTSLSVAQAAVALVAVNLSGAGLRLLVGWWSDWTGVRLGPFLVVAVCMVAAFDLLAVYISLGGPFLEVFVVLVGALALSWNGLAFVVAAELAPPGRSGSFLGFENTAIYLASAVGAVLVGFLADRLDWATVMGALTLPALLAATVLAFILSSVRTGV